MDKRGIHDKLMGRVVYPHECDYCPKIINNPEEDRIHLKKHFNKTK